MTCTPRKIEKMGDNHDKDTDILIPWSAAIKIIGMGHGLGLVLCGVALVGLRTNANVVHWLEVAALLFALGVLSSVFALISMRSASYYDDEVRQHLDPSFEKHPQELLQIQQNGVARMVIAFLLTLSSVVAFFCACATALIAFLRY